MNLSADLWIANYFTCFVIFAAFFAAVIYPLCICKPSTETISDKIEKDRAAAEKSKFKKLFFDNRHTIMYLSLAKGIATNNLNAIKDILYLFTVPMYSGWLHAIMVFFTALPYCFWIFATFVRGRD